MKKTPQRRSGAIIPLWIRNLSCPLWPSWLRRRRSRPPWLRPPRARLRQFAHRLLSGKRGLTIALWRARHDRIDVGQLINQKEYICAPSDCEAFLVSRGSESNRALRSPPLSSSRSASRPLSLSLLSLSYLSRSFSPSLRPVSRRSRSSRRRDSRGSLSRLSSSLPWSRLSALIVLLYCCMHEDRNK